MRYSENTRLLARRCCEHYRNRPTIELPYTFSNKIVIALTFFLCFATVVFSIIVYSRLPEIITIHYNWKGEPDKTGSKYTVFILPIIQNFLSIFMVFLSKFPKYYNYPVDITEENAEYQYNLARQFILQFNLFIVIYFTSLQVIICEIALNNIGNQVIVFLIIVFIPMMIILIIYYVCKARNNQ